MADRDALRPFTSPTTAVVDGACLAKMTMGRMSPRLFDVSYLKRLVNKNWVRQLPISWTFRPFGEDLVDLEITGPIGRGADGIEDYSIIFKTMRAILFGAERERERVLRGLEVEDEDASEHENASNDDR